MRLSVNQRVRHLHQMLEEALQKQEAWRPSIYKAPQNAMVEISPESRDETVRWLAQLNIRFRFHPETFAMAVSILDRFLQTVKARPKYLQCIGVACFYLAAKTLEEDEVIPETLELVRETQCGCTISEVMRMERIVLDKLNWSLHAVTPLDFLHMFHALLMMKSPHLLDRFRHMVPSQQLSLLTDKLHCLLCSHPFLHFPPATLALSLISLELELFTPDWFPTTLWLQSLAAVDIQELIRCREFVTRHLVSQRIANTVYIYMPHAAPSGNKPTKRKVEEMDDDDLYDGIKRLYNEDADLVTVAMTSCGFEACQDAAKSPSLQAVAN